MLGKPSPEYFAAALEALDADAELTWMVGDDLDGDIVGGQAAGMRTVLVRTGKFRPDDLEHTRVSPDGIVSSIAQLPDWLEANPVTALRVGVDLIEIARVRRALDRHGDGFRERCFTDAERAYCDSKPNPAAALRGPLRGQGGGRQGARLGRLLHLARDRDPRPAEARRPSERQRRPGSPSGSARVRSSCR